MALPEDDVEEVDPEPALARILDHEHDAIVIGPGPASGPGHGGARPAPDCRRRTGWRRSCSTPRRCARSPTLDAWWVGGTADPRSDLRTRASLPGCAPARAGTRRPTETSPATMPPGSVAAARDAAASWRQVVVLKGARTVIATPDGKSSIAPFENPALASGGTGDVLAGPSDPCWHRDSTRSPRPGWGLPPRPCGRRGRERFGDAGLLASDLLDGLAVVRRRLAAIGPEKLPAVGSGSGRVPPTRSTHRRSRDLDASREDRLARRPTCGAAAHHDPTAGRRQASACR